MAGASEGWHEREDVLSAKTKDLHRALVSLQEELEAWDWYQQRVEGAYDPELRQILEHNRDEEKEHAAMIVEWLRRHDVVWARQLKEQVGRGGAIVREEEEEHGKAEGDRDDRGGKGGRRG